jgi:hypothetical protein
MSNGWLYAALARFGIHDGRKGLEALLRTCTIAKNHAHHPRTNPRRAARSTTLGSEQPLISSELLGYVLPSGESFTFTVHAVYLPRPRIEISGPQGVRASFDWQAARDAGVGRMCTATLVSDFGGLLKTDRCRLVAVDYGAYLPRDAAARNRS